jgi:hypothetical protein
MANSIKYSATSEDNALNVGNFWIGVGDSQKGPSASTGFWHGVEPPAGGYIIYSYAASRDSKISFYSANSDAQLIEFTNGISGQNFTTAIQCLNWFATQTNYACVNVNYPPIITNGLVLNLDAGFTPSYPTNGTTSYDLSYEGNNGTLVNGTPYSSLDGGYFMFDGTNDYINVGVGKSCNGFTGDFAVSVWVNRSPNGITWGNIIGDYYTNNTANPLEWQIMISNTAQLFVYNVTNGYVINPINSGFNTDSWINVVLSRIGSTITLYANSNTITAVTNGTTFGSSTGNINIGVDGNNSAEALNGKIANVLIYKNKGLTSSEVLQNYNAGLSRFNTSNIVKDNLILDLNASNSVSYPTTGTEWRDLSGNGNKGTLTNGPTFDSTSKSIVFDGIDDFMISNISSKDLDGDPSFTVDMFVKRNQGTNIGPSNGFWGIGGSGQGNSVQGWTPTQNLIHLDVYDSTRIATSEYYPENQYIHLVWTKNGPGQETTNVKCYINGVEKTLTKTRNATRPNQFNTSTNGVCICLGRINGDSPTYYSPVTVNSFRVYKKALSESEILQNYYKSQIVTSGLVMALDAGNVVSYPGSGTSWKDLTINGNNSTLYNGPTFSDVNGGVISFDGSDDYATAGNFFTYQSFTINLWVKPGSSQTTYADIIDNNHTGAQNWVCQQNADDLNQYQFGVFGSSGQNSLTGTFTLTSNVWVNLTFTYDGDKVRGYINGSLFGTGNSLGTTIHYAAPTFNIGRWNSGGRNWNGQYGAISVYDRPLTLQEISQNYNATKARFGL